MKVIKNISLQGLQIPFQAENNVKYVFLAPRKQIEVPNNWNSQVAENLVHRRMVKIFVTDDPTPVIEASKTNKKRVK